MTTRPDAGRRLGALALCAAVIAAAGCRSEKTETMRVAKEGTSAPASAPAGGEMSGGDMGGGQMSGGQPMAMPNDSIHAGLTGGGTGSGDMSGGAMGGGAAGGTASLHWTAPFGWSEKAPSSMRVGSYDVPGSAGPADMSIVVLSGQAGGDLANVNRWRGQIGLAPIDEVELAKTAHHMQTPAGDVMVVEFGGADAGGKRMLAGILSQSTETWFFKLVGPDATVSAARPDFMKLVESLHGAAD